MLLGTPGATAALVIKMLLIRKKNDEGCTFHGAEPYL